MTPGKNELLYHEEWDSCGTKEWTGGTGGLMVKTHTPNLELQGLSPLILLTLSGLPI